MKAKKIIGEGRELFEKRQTSADVDVESICVYAVCLLSLCIGLDTLVNKSPRRLPCSKSQGQIVVCLFQEHFQGLPGKESLSFLTCL